MNRRGFVRTVLGAGAALYVPERVYSFPSATSRLGDLDGLVWPPGIMDEIVDFYESERRIVRDISRPGLAEVEGYFYRISFEVERA